MYSPRWLFFYPGISLLIFGVFGLSIIYSGTVNIDRLNFDVHTMAVAGLLVNVGLQLLFFSIFIRIFAIVNGLFPPKKRHQRFLSLFSLERGIVAGIFTVVLGIIYWVQLFSIWSGLGFGEIENLPFTFRMVISGTTLILAGFQMIFSSFFIQILLSKK